MCAIASIVTVDWLVECGLKAERAFWLLHHENKAGQISGDWGRHPDTKVQLQADGNQPRTKIYWEKTRWAVLPTDERPKTQLLDWIIETKSYRASDVELGGVVSDSVLRQRLDEYLADHPGTSKTTITSNVQGNAERLRTLLDDGVEEGRYDVEKGSRGAHLFYLSPTAR
jgi:hypothetical protein